MFADIILNNSYSRIKESLVYKIPESLLLKKGDLVIAPFRNKKNVGLVLNIHEQSPEFKTQYIEENLAPNIFLYDWQIKLAEWISDYYFCSTMDAYKLFLPKGIWKVPKLKKEAETKIDVNESAESPIKEIHLHSSQKLIINRIINENIPTSLIFGITGSGKTEVYKKLIQDTVKNGKQALLMVPEISLTPQMINYFKNSFPEISVIHSKLGEKKKTEEWKKIHKGASKLVIGSRSSIFSPFKNLGIIIMDEEHEWTYKQEQSPRYHARDLAYKIQELTGAKLIFGSATPSIETFYRAKNHEIELFTMKERAYGAALPKVEIVDMREEIKKRNFTIFSDHLIEKIKEKLEKKEQILLFLNRRGSATATVCRDCGLALDCNNCDSKLTYHISKFVHATLICHHCGLITKMPDLCPNCKSPRIRHLGGGTEKVESELRKLFPLARIERADKDTMSKKDSFEILHKKLNSQEIDILIGTQMIGKGFDIAKISLVGIVLADHGLHIPDFRSAERTYQLLSQVAGRSGRRENQGEVIIQTYSPENSVLKFAKEHDYESFSEQEISTRKLHDLPPFQKIIKLIYANENKEESKEKTHLLQIQLQNLNNNEYKIYSAPALLSKVNKYYYWHLYIHGENPHGFIKKINPNILEGWRIDVDPIQTV